MTDDEEWGWDPDDIRPLTADEWRAVRALLPDLEQLVGDEWASRPPLNDRGWPDEDDLAESPWFRLHLSCGKKGHPEVMTATWPCGDGSWLFADYPNVATIHGKPAPRVVTLTMDKEPGDDDPLVDDELGYYPLWGAFLNEVTRDGWRAYLAEYQRTGGVSPPTTTRCVNGVSGGCSNIVIGGTTRATPLGLGGRSSRTVATASAGSTCSDVRTARPW